MSSRGLKPAVSVARSMIFRLQSLLRFVATNRPPGSFSWKSRRSLRSG